MSNRDPYSDSYLSFLSLYMDWLPPNPRWKLGSDIDESACSVFLGCLEVERRAGRLHAIRAHSYKGLHVGLCYPVPDQVACISVSSFAHCLAGRIVVQKLNRRICNSRRVLERNQRPAPIGQEFGGVPVRSRDNRLPGAQSVRQCPRYGLCLVAVWGDVDVSRTNQRSHFLRADESVVEDHVLLNPQLFG